MTFDYKKEYKEFYMPKGTPSIVTVPKINYIAVRGTSTFWRFLSDRFRYVYDCSEMYSERSLSWS